MDCVLEYCLTWREEPWGEVSANIRDITMSSFELCLHVVMKSRTQITCRRSQEI